MMPCARRATDLSLGIVLKAPEGIVLAAESRLTLAAEDATTHEKVQVSFDNATKLLAFQQNDGFRPVGVVTYGQAGIGTRTAASFVPEFESRIVDEPLNTEQFAERLATFYKEQWDAAMPKDYAGPPMSFAVGGYDPGAAYGRVFMIEIPQRAEPVELNKGDGDFGITWGGQSEHMDRLLRGFDRRLPELVAKALNLTAAQRQALEAAILPLQMPLPLQAMPLQDCVDLAVFFIRTTITAQSLTIGTRGVGGPIDVATVTRSRGLEFIQRKRVRVEQR
jgi:hypothetical protein